MSLNERFQVGIITGTHGLKGEVKVLPTSDEPRRFDTLEEVILDSGRAQRRVKIRSVKYFKQFAILGFEGMDRIEDVERMRGSTLWIGREDAVPLEEGEYFIPDLLGLKAVTDDGRELGVLRDVLQTGANDVYVVRGGKGSKEYMLPAIPECILGIDLEAGTMPVHLMPGLEDL